MGAGTRVNRFQEIVYGRSARRLDSSRLAGERKDVPSFDDVAKAARTEQRPRGARQLSDQSR